MQRMVDDWEPIVFNTTLYRDSGNMPSHNAHSSFWTFSVMYLNENRVFVFKMHCSSYFIELWRFLLLKFCRGIILLLIGTSTVAVLGAHLLLWGYHAADGRLFLQVDKYWKEIMRNTVKDPKVYILCMCVLWHLNMSLCTRPQFSDCSIRVFYRNIIWSKIMMIMTGAGCYQFPWTLWQVEGEQWFAG